MKRDLTYDYDFSAQEIWDIFKLAKELKDKQKRGQAHQLLARKSLAMIFQKPSTRTRVSFEVGMTQLGGHALYLSSSDLQLSRGETISDVARVLSRYVDGIMARVFNQSDIIDLARNASVPVINGLSDEFHPCQILTDFFTILEQRGNLKNLTIAFVGDGNNNITNSLILTAARLGINLNIASPEKYQVKPEIFDLAKSDMQQTGAVMKTHVDPSQAVQAAEVIYTDCWVSMGRTDTDERIKAFQIYQVNQALVAKAKKGAMVMHCLPAHRGQEITDEVIYGPQSIIFDQAENRLHVQKAILVKILQ